MTYISRLREVNAQIQELVKSINSYKCNERLYDTMRDEYIEKRRRLQDLKMKWENEYIPALQMRQDLRGEMYTIDHQWHKFENQISAQLAYKSESEIEKSINYFEKRISELREEPLTPPPDRESTISERCDSLSGSITSRATSISTFITNTEGSVPQAQDKYPELKVGYMWTLSSAESMLEELKQEYGSSKQKRRSLGTQTCELSVKLKALELDLTAMESSMYIPPLLLYRDLKLEHYISKSLCYKKELNTRRHLSPTENTKLAENIRPAIKGDLIEPPNITFEDLVFNFP